MMHAQVKKTFANELACFTFVIRTEGWIGLYTRGFDLTVARETPINAIYLDVFESLITSIQSLGPVGAPFVCGAIIGCACWIPVYPIDVVNTRNKMRLVKSLPALGKSLFNYMKTRVLVSS